jgi:hypothetical protein
MSLFNQNNFQKLFGNYPVVPNTSNTESDDIRNTVSYPVIAGAIDDKNYYHQLKVHYAINCLYYSSAYDHNKLNEQPQNVVFEYIRTSYRNFAQIMNLQEKRYYLSSSNSLSSIEQSVYPMGLRYMDTENDVIVFERPPFKISVDFTPIKSAYSKRRKKFETKDMFIWIPWTVYLFDMSSKNHINVSVYFNNKPLSSCEDIVFPYMLPNVFPEGRVCFGDDLQFLNKLHTDMVQNKKYSLKSIFNETLSYLYSGGWNADLVPCLPYPNFLVMYPNVRAMKNAIKNPRALSMYERASSIATYYDIDKLRSARLTGSYWSSSANESYLNALAIWSQYSLEEVMYLFGDYYENARKHYASGAPYDEYYNSRSGVALDSVIRGIGMVKSNDCELKRQKLSGVFSTFVNGNNVQNAVNYKDDILDSSVPHEVNFGSGTALRQVYYLNPITNEGNLRTKVFKQEELHDILDHLIKQHYLSGVSREKLPNREELESSYAE